MYLNYCKIYVVWAGDENVLQQGKLLELNFEFSKVTQALQMPQGKRRFQFEKKRRTLFHRNDFKQKLKCQD